MVSVLRVAKTCFESDGQLRCGSRAGVAWHWDMAEAGKVKCEKGRPVGWLVEQYWLNPAR